VRVLILTAALFAASTCVAHGASSGFFKTPSANIVCFWSTDGLDCTIKSGLKPPPKKRKCTDFGDFTTNRLALGKTGKATPVTCSGDVGPVAGEKQAKVLGYGKTKTFGRLHCTSTKKGLPCRNRTHGFFLSRDRWKAL